MINIKKQINYWITASENDIDTAELLINNNKYLNGLFFCHLVIEKAIKAHFVKKLLEKYPPNRTTYFFYLKRQI